MECIILLQFRPTVYTCFRNEATISCTTYLHVQVVQCTVAQSFQPQCSPSFVEELPPHLPMRHWVCVSATGKRFPASIHHNLQLGGSSQSGLAHSLAHQGTAPAYASQKHCPAHCKELQCLVSLNKSIYFDFDRTISSG